MLDIVKFVLILSIHLILLAIDLRGFNNLAKYHNLIFAPDILMETLLTLHLAFDEEATGTKYFSPNDFMGNDVKTKPNVGN